MKAYFGIKFYEDHQNRDEIEAITEVLIRAGIETICMAKDVENWGEAPLSSAEDLMKVTFQQIDSTDLTILEMSEKGVGLGIEAGYAVAKKKPLIILIEAESKLSTTMQGIADYIITYEDASEISIDYDKLSSVISDD